jgi:hypothetical protein
MDALTLWLGLVIVVGSLIGWLTSIYLNRRRKRVSGDGAKN